MDGSLSIDIAELIARDPQGFLSDIERELVEIHGLSMFIRLGWHTIEGSEATYRSNWHIDAVCEHLEAVSLGHIKRLGINIPPRHMKSISTAVMWPAWDWIKTPWRRFMFASYAHNLSIRDSTKCRRVIQSPWYQKRWGNTFKLTGDQNTKIRFENDRNGYRLSTSVGGSLTGEGGDIIVVDDPHNVIEAESDTVRTATTQWWDESMTSRLNDPKTGAFVIIQQRVHEKDLIGHVLSKKDQNWTILCLPAEFDPKAPTIWARDPRKEPGELLWPEHIGREQIEQFKIDLGPYAYAGQFQQAPAPREGGLFKRSWFRIVKFAPDDCVWARGWDFAASEKSLVRADPDWTATAMVGWSASQQAWYLAHVDRWREEPHEVEKLLVQRAAMDPPDTLIRIPQDPGAAGKSVAQRMLTLLAEFPVTAAPVSGDKVLRAMAWAGKANGGLIHLVEGPWNEMFLTELTSFPTGSHDDMVDAVGSAFEILTNNTFGIMEFYRRESERVAGLAAERQELKEQAVAAGQVTYEGMGPALREPTIEEYARALAGKTTENK